ncbi:MAG TPA: hypothetical protein VD862_01475 [Candidatus Paceibacterota bacterium]|nr:hypothetical protein [Candidatus Paceibacterota bacterium]
MKRIVLFLACAIAAPAVVRAQAPAPPNTFATMAECSGALVSGAYRYYEPKYFGLRNNEPADGKSRVVVPLESDTCLEMLVVGGRRFVVQREGTLFRAFRRTDGTLVLYARNDCGNPVYGMEYPPYVTPVEPEPGPEAAEWTPILPPLPGPPPPDVRVVVQQFNTERDRAEDTLKKKGGFCSSRKCRWTLGILAAGAAGTAAWYYWPCPPGTERR